MALSDRIKQRREVLKLSQGELARRAKVTQGMLSRVEAGTTEPGSPMLRRLAIALRCSADWLLEMYDDAPDDISDRMLAGASP